MKSMSEAKFNRETREASPQAGYAAQFAVANVLVGAIGREKITPKTIKDLGRPLSMGMRTDNIEQELQVRETTARMIGMVAWIAAEGDPKKADELIGGSLIETGIDVTSPEFASRMQHMINRQRRTP